MELKTKIEINYPKMDKLFDQALEDIKALIKIKSYAQSGDQKYPYGEEVHQALDKILEIGKKLGFEVHYGPQKKYGYIDYGQGSKMLGVLCHLDVVPPGDLKKWENLPFEPIIKNGYLFGRGALDDKGPAVINLYALKYLIDQGFKPKHKIRFIFGLTEETSWDSIGFYLQNEIKPDYSYVPDGYFPLVYAEKTIQNLYIKETNPQQNFTIEGGQAFNVTCDRATYTGPNKKELVQEFDKLGYKHECKSESTTVLGKIAHGSKPQEGINAALQLIDALKVFDHKSQLIDWVNKYLGFDFNGFKIFGDLKDETGELTINLGMINFNKKENFISFDLRIPLHTTRQQVLDKLKASLNPYGLILSEHNFVKGLYFDQKSKLVQNLLSVYRQVTNDNREPLAIGGGTYARALDNAIAFGAIFDHTNSTEHQYNEKVSIKDLHKAMEIYIRTLALLTKEDGLI